MMDRTIPLFVAVPFEQREIGNPHKIECVRVDQSQLFAKTAPEVSQRVVYDLALIGHKKYQVSGFYPETLGCPMTKSSDRADVFQIGPDFFLGVAYDEDAPTMEERKKSLWLELSTADLEDTKQRILAAGVPELEYFDKEHFYFQAPGGQVYRLIASGEDMSKYQGTRCG